MKIQNFKLERLFAMYKPKTKYMLSQTACAKCSMREILDMADEECLKMWENLSLGYTSNDGFLPLREAISTRYTSIRPADILELTPEEGVFIFMNCMLEPGDEVIVVHPTLPTLYEIPRAIGCTVIKWPLEATQWGWHLDINFLAENISPKTKLIIMNVPNNPTGYIPVRAEIDRILNFADRNGTWIFNEETARGLEHDPAAILPSLADIYPRAVALGGLNKYGLPGTRIGWLASKNRQMLSACAAFKDYTTLCNNAPGEILATIAMRNAPDLLKRNHDIVLKNLALVEALFKKHANLFEWIRPNGGATAFPRLLSHFNVMEMCERAMAEKQIFILGERAFGIDTNHFRVGFGRLDFPETLAAFDEFVEQIQAELESKN